MIYYLCSFTNKVSSLKPEGRKSKFKAALDLPGLAELAGQVLNSRPLNIDLLVRAQVKGYLLCCFESFRDFILKLLQYLLDATIPHCLSIIINNILLINWVMILKVSLKLFLLFFCN